MVKTDTDALICSVKYHWKPWKWVYILKWLGLVIHIESKFDSRVHYDIPLFNR